MELYLQFGHGMMEHCRHLIESWGGGTVILSPRDLTPQQIERFGPQIVASGGKVLVDPQLYDPRATHHRLVGHEYWPEDFDTGMLAGGPRLALLLERLNTLNDKAQAEQFVVPGVYCERVDDDWIAIQQSVIAEAASVARDKPRIATVCLSGETLRFEEQIETVINAAEQWNVQGVYVVPEHPGAQYLADDPMWITNLLLLCSGFRLQRKSVIEGYCSHQMLCLACAQVDAMASGTWLNVRSFTPDKFQEAEDDAVSRRVKWYYCPTTFSEYKIPFMDMAYRAGLLDSLRSAAALSSHYADILFSGAQPSSTDYSEQMSHRHYLHCLHAQASLASRSSFRETLDANMQLLTHAESLIRRLRQRAISGQDRDFANIIDVNRAALIALDDARGFVLERSW